MTSEIAPDLSADTALTVAYDLRYASDHFPGIGTHAFHLFEALLALPGRETYAAIWNPALANSRFDLDRIQSHPRVRWIETPARPLGFATPWETGRLLRSIAPGVVFSPFYLAPWRAGCPRVLTLHDVLPLQLMGAVGARGRSLFRFAMRGTARAEAVVTSSEASRSEIIRRAGIAAARVHVVRPGIAPRREAEHVARPASLPEGAFALVVGINKPHKNLETLARAWARFGAEPPLRLVGAGPNDPRYPGLDSLARRFDARGVTQLGRVSEPELGWLYRNATLTVFPTLAEGFGFPLLEAHAIGCPAVVSDLPVLREIGEGAACFVDPLDAVRWAAAVKELATDGAAREAMAAAGRARAAEFGYERTARETLAVLRSVAVS